MTPQQAIYIEAFRQILANAEDYPIEGYSYPDTVDESNVDKVRRIFEDSSEADALDEILSDIRGSGVATGLRSREYSRHYECREVAARLAGVWVGWTYWHGGGKHGEPEAIDWISDAYFLNVKEERRMVTVRTFERDGETGKPVLALGEQVGG